MALRGLEEKVFLRTLPFQKLMRGASREDTISSGVMTNWLQWAALTVVVCIFSQSFTHQEILIAFYRLTPKHDHEQVYVPCHPSQVSYQKHMGGVDLSDQLIKNFSVIRKSRKAWEKPLSYDLKVYLLDSFIIMSKAKPLSAQKFIDYQVVS